MAYITQERVAVWKRSRQVAKTLDLRPAYTGKNYCVYAMTWVNFWKVALKRYDRNTFWSHTACLVRWAPLCIAIDIYQEAQADYHFVAMTELSRPFTIALACTLPLAAYNNPDDVPIDIRQTYSKRNAATAAEINATRLGVKL